MLYVIKIPSEEAKAKATLEMIKDLGLSIFPKFGHDDVIMMQIHEVCYVAWNKLL
jgi:hypothetical protein